VTTRTKLSSKINHLAIIPDGNRRWAQKHNYISREVYKEGTQRLYEVLDYLADCKIKYFTFWSSSLSNLKHRPGDTLNLFDTLYAENFERPLSEKLVWDHQVRILVYGAWRGLLKPKTEQIIDEVIFRTKDHSGMVLTVLIGYDGRLERGNAVLSLMNAMKRGIVAISSDPLGADAILRSHSWTSALPQVDLIIRTGSWKDPHMSADFLTFLSGEAQFVFPPVLWPDFTVTELEMSFRDFCDRERRYGK
jgi:undecaprenyl diphosphate synthase